MENENLSSASLGMSTWVDKDYFVQKMDNGRIECLHVLTFHRHNIKYTNKIHLNPRLNGH